MKNQPTFDVVPTILNQVIAQRRTIKPENYTGEIIPKDIILQLLENANWAPTHGKTEPWRFTIFAGDAKTELSETLANFYKENTAAEKFNETKFNKYAERSAKASHIIAICVKRKPKVRIPLIEDIEAVACAVQNLHLSATAYGIAGYWHSGSMTYKQAAKDYLNLAEEDRCLGFFYLGYSAKAWPVGKKQPIADKIEWRQ